MIRLICSTMMSLLKLTILVIFGVVNFQNYGVNSQSVEATTTFPLNPKIDNDGIDLRLTRLENLYADKLEYLINDTNSYIQSLEAKVENLGKNIQELLDATRNLPSDVEAIKRNVSSLINVTKSVKDCSSNSELQQIFNQGLQEIKDLQTANSKSGSDKQYPKNCREVREFEKTASGNYMIQPQHSPKPFLVVCDLETRGGGWTVIQKRFDGSQDFYLGWEDYKKGFGSLGGEFWLGLENIHLLTEFDENELLIELGDFESRNKSAFYFPFSIGSAVEGYSLKVLGAYSGDAGDSLTFHAGNMFSTKDKDQDSKLSHHCARFFSGAWWYKDCASSNLNGKYFGRGQVPQNPNHAIFWSTSDNNYSGLKYTRMLVRPKA